MKQKPKRPPTPPQASSPRLEESSPGAAPWKNRTPDQKPQTVGARWWWHALAILLLMVVNFALYHRSLGLGFFSLDDHEYITRNPFITSFSLANVKHILTVPYFANFAPAHLLSYTLDVVLAGGKSAWALHLSNVLWQGFAIAMVYLLAWTLRADLLTATGAALLFAVHPTHVEVAAWISSRKDLVATSFAACSMACYLRYARRQPGGGWWWAGSLVGFIIAGAAKQSVILLPMVMVAWDVLVEKRRTWWLIADKVPFGLVTLFFGWMTWHAQPSTHRTYDLVTMAAIELQNLQLLTGFGSHVLYRHSPEPAGWSGLVRAAVVAGAVIAWIIPLLFVRFRKPRFAVLGYWMLIQMVPPMVLSFVIPVTDRYLFLPSVGICLLLPLAARAMAERIPTGSGNGIVLGITLLVGVPWGVQASHYLDEWCDPRTVWYFSAPQVQNGPAYEFAGNAFHDSADRIDAALTSGKLETLTNELPLARIVIGNASRLEALRAEWAGTMASRTNSDAYAGNLRKLAWEDYELAVKYRGMINTPNLYLRRGMILVSQGRMKGADREFHVALEFATSLKYERSRHEAMIGILRSIGILHWNLRDYPTARDWFLKAQQEQNQSGEIWVPTLDDEVARITKHAEGR